MQWMAVMIELNPKRVRILEQERVRFADLVRDICPAPSFEDFAIARLEVTRKGIQSEDMGRIALAFGHYLSDACPLVPKQHSDLPQQLATAFLETIFLFKPSEHCFSECKTA